MKTLRNIVIGSLFILTQLSASLYIPSLPSLSHYFNVAPAAMMLTISIFFGGYAVGQLTWGTASDYIGRKKSIQLSLSLYLIIAACLTASGSYFVFIALTSILGFSAAAYTSVGNALLKDIFGKKVGHAIGYVGIAMAVAPTLAPILGAHLIQWFGWQATYLFLFCYATLSMVLVSCLVKETHHPHTQTQATLKSALKKITTHPQFIGYVLPLGLMFGAFFAYLAAAPFIFINYLGYSVTEFSYIAFSTTIPLVAGTIYNSYKLKHSTTSTLLNQGLIISLVGSIGLMTVAILSFHALAPVIFFLGIFMLGIGIIVPTAKAGAMQVLTSHSGKASSMMKFTQTLGCFVITAIASQLHSTTSIIPITSLFFIVTVLSVSVSFFFLKTPKK